MAVPTDRRTAKAAVLPHGTAGDSLSLLHAGSAGEAGRLATNLNCVWLDWVDKRKMQRANLTKHTLWQLPILPQEAYHLETADGPAEEVVDRLVRRLSHTSHSLDAWAAEQAGEAVTSTAWDPEQRQKDRTTLDALYALLYGLGDNEVERCCGTGFPTAWEAKGEAWRDRLLAEKARLRNEP